MSTKLVLSDDGKKVRRLQPFTEADVDELQSRIVVAENLPEDHCYQNLMKIFVVVGSIKTIRTSKFELGWYDNYHWMVCQLPLAYHQNGFYH
ncbi:hypothetical protein KSP39_PZI013689 [Platanthera zijinensis]|uniref:Uncharacterized protein n=1 Tax=Platanthera zijinensis TaxID=2320716 RepID=A0AAP0BCT6_9ASPA